LDRALIIKRMRNGRKAKAADGKYAGFGSPAFGLRSDDGMLVTDDTEAATIALIQGLAASGMSLREITAELNADGIKSNGGGAWPPETVARVLQRARQTKPH